MTSISHNLERLIQMISIEQLLGIAKQNTNITASNNTDILSTPIVQKVVKAYEDELNTLNNATAPIKDYSEDIAKIHKQLADINNNLLQLSEAIKSISFVPNIPSIPNEEHIQLKIEEIKNEEQSRKIILIPESESESESESEDEDLSHLVKRIAISEAALPVASSVVNLEEELSVSSLRVLLQSFGKEEEPVVNSVASLEEEESESVASLEEEASESVASLEEEVSESVASLEEEASEEEVSDEEEVEEPETKVEDEEEEEVFEIEIDDITYYATSEENGILYQVDKDGEVGKQVGIIKDGEPIFS